MTAPPRKLVVLLWALLFAFCLRVLGQALVAFAGVTWLPPMAVRWFGGAIPIVFHWVLACSVIAFGHYHRTRLSAR
ncbi:MAG: hypothetical protein AB1555_07555 [Nitrospirota bacterium]